MDFRNKVIEEIVEMRIQVRTEKNFKLSDEMRDFLDSKNVFCFDLKGGGQDTHYLPEKYFSRMEKLEGLHNIKFRNRRHYVEWEIQQDIACSQRCVSWLFSHGVDMETCKAIYFPDYSNIPFGSYVGFQGGELFYENGHTFWSY